MPESPARTRSNMMDNDKMPDAVWVGKPYIEILRDGVTGDEKYHHERVVKELENEVTYMDAAMASLEQQLAVAREALELVNRAFKEDKISDTTLISPSTGETYSLSSRTLKALQQINGSGE